MSTSTTNIGLSLTPESTSKTFKAWRMEIDGDVNSNMIKIDTEFGKMNKNLKVTDGDDLDKVYDMSAGIEGGTPIITMKNGNDEESISMPNKKQFDTMNILLAAISDGDADITINDYEDIQQIIRMGLAREQFSVGDQFIVNKTSTVTAAVSPSSTGITAATVNFQTFLNGMGMVPAGVYVFKYSDGEWTYSGNNVSLSTYGITITGSPANNDSVIITTTGKELVFDIMDIDYDTPADGRHSHSVSLCLHDIATYGTIPFDATEALYYAEEGLAAGDYSFTVANQAWYAADNGVTYYFTLTNAVPAGGQLVLSMTYNAALEGKSVKVFANSTTTAVSETATLSATPIADAVSLGTTNGVGNINHMHRAIFGSNKYSESAMRQYINSTAAGAASGEIASWWSPKNKFDRPVVTTIPGFLYGVDPAFVAILGAVKKRTGLNTVTDGGGYTDTDETVFLQSRYELGYGAENNVIDTSPDVGGTPVARPYAYWTNATNADRIKYEGSTARYWWLRSPYPSIASNERYVNTSGALNNYVGANNAYGAVPGLCII